MASHLLKVQTRATLSLSFSLFLSLTLHRNSGAAQRACYYADMTFFKHRRLNVSAR